MPTVRVTTIKPKRERCVLCGALTYLKMRGTLQPVCEGCLENHRPTGG